MNRLALGTVQFGMEYGIANNSGQFSSTEIKEVLRLAKINDIDTLDTAISYGDSEKKLGKNNLDEFNIVTKIPKISEHKNIDKLILEYIKTSLERLNISNIYGVLLHNSDDINTPHGDAVYESLLNLKEMGLVKKIGVSIYSPEELKNIYSNFFFDIIQSPFNIFDTRLKDSGWMTKLSKRGVEIHPRSPFLQWLLLQDKDKLPIKFLKWNKLFSAWENFVDNNKMTKMEACLQFAKSFKEINKVLVGVDNVNQFKEILSFNFQKNFIDFQDFSCSDEMLINPSNWKLL